MTDTDRALLLALPVIGLLSIAYGLLRAVALGESPMLVGVGAGTIAVWLALRAETAEESATREAPDPDGGDTT